MDRVVNLAKRRGLVFPSREIYGGFRSTWDYGPLGVLLKRNVKDAWWRSMVQLRDDVVGLDAAILMAPKVWEASGHVATFTDPLVDCRNCNERFRADHLPESGACPNCGAKDSFTEARQFNLMFKTYVGPVEDDASVAYLRPETAQGIFVNFKNVQTTDAQEAAVRHRADRQVVPQRDHARATSSSARASSSRWRWSTSCRPTTARSGSSTGAASASSWYVDLGIPEEQLRLRPHDPEELSHYSAGTSDVEFMYPWGWGELEGIANRTDYDLTQHAKFSGEDLTYFDQEQRAALRPARDRAGGRRRPRHARVPPRGVRRGRGRRGGEKRTVLRLDPRLAPIKVAVLPLSQNEKLMPGGRRGRGDAAPALHDRRRRRGCDRPALPPPGRGRHAAVRHVDFDTLDDDAVTVRDRDTMEQERVPIDGVLDDLHARLDVSTDSEHSMTMDDDYYELLGVDADAPTDEIRAAYREQEGRARPTKGDKTAR